MRSSRRHRRTRRSSIEAKHFCYSAGWKKFERAWDLVIRIKQLSQMRPVLEAVLAPVDASTDSPEQRQPIGPAPARELPLIQDGF